MSTVINNQQPIDHTETKLVRDVLTSCCAVANTRNNSRYSVSPRKQGNMHVFKIQSTTSNVEACKSTIDHLKHHGVDGWELFHGKSQTGDVVGLKKIL